eukprot:scaffold25478_cov101-Isochrysis_galbana.AAC.2
MAARMASCVVSRRCTSCTDRRAPCRYRASSSSEHGRAFAKFIVMRWPCSVGSVASEPPKRCRMATAVSSEKKLMKAQDLGRTWSKGEGWGGGGGRVPVGRGAGR